MSHYSCSSRAFFPIAHTAIAFALFELGCRPPQPAESAPTCSTSEQSTLGAAESPAYTAEYEPSGARLAVVVSEVSHCAVLPFEVTSCSDGTTSQRALPPRGTRECQSKPASDATVYLQAGGNTYPMGKTDAQGRTEANLAGLMLPNGQSISELSTGTVHLRDRHDQKATLSDISFESLKAWDKHLSALKKEFLALFESPLSQLNGTQRARIFSLDGQLAQYAPLDAEASGLRNYFAKLNLMDNLEYTLHKPSLQRLRQTLKSPASSKLKVPQSVKTAVEQGVPNPEASHWANRVILANVNSTSPVCADGSFEFEPSETEVVANKTSLALEVFHFFHEESAKETLSLAACQPQENLSTDALLPNQSKG